MGFVVFWKTVFETLSESEVLLDWFVKGLFAAVVIIPLTVIIVKLAKKGRKAKSSAPVITYAPVASAPANSPARYVVPPTEPLKGWSICKEMLEQSHLLVGGTTGAGKSTLAHSIIYTLATSGSLAAQFYGIDLKRVELAVWEKLPHCRGIAKTPEDAMQMIQTVNGIVDSRISYMENAGLRNYNGGDVYLIIDELAELLAVNRKAVVDGLSRIMRLGRAAKVHVIGFTQAPNRSKGGGLDPLLCQNFTAAVALRCRSAIESRQIVGVAGAEQLPLHGYGLFWSSRGTEEIEIPMTSDEKIAERVAVWRR